MLDNPPSGVRYMLYDPDHFRRIRKLAESTWVPGRLARRIYWLARYNRLVDKALVHVSNYWDYSLIRMRRRFVADTENVGTFISGWRFEDLHSPHIRRAIEKSIRSKYCKKIMPLTCAARRTMEAVFNLQGVEEKIEVVYPAIRPLEADIREHDHETRILFVGNDFLIKGGRELLEAFRVIDGKYDAKLVIVSQEAYRNLRPGRNIEVFPYIPRKELLSKFYSNADIFCLPTYADSFAFVFLEAKAAGLPIISTTHFHVPEIVEDWKSGLLIKAPISCWKSNLTFDIGWYDRLRNSRFPEAVSELAEKLSILIEDTSLRRKMGNEGRREVMEGRFSMEVRNRKLKEIYTEAANK